MWQGYSTDGNFYKIFLTETFLSSSLVSEYDRLKIEGYNFITSDNRSDLKKGGICVYYKKHVPLIKRGDLSMFSK